MAGGDDRRRREAAEALFDGVVDDLRQTLGRLGGTERDALIDLAEAVSAAWIRGGKLLVCGNGGSAADTQHIVAELVGRFLMDRPARPALALTTNSSILTAVGNDYGFDRIFARQVEGLGRREDLLLVISTSGNSPNCVEAVEAARRIGMAAWGLLGAGGGRLAGMLDGAVVVPNDHTPRIQEVHITMGHLLCRLLEDWHADAPQPGNGDDD